MPGPDASILATAPPLLSGPGAQGLQPGDQLGGAIPGLVHERNGLPAALHLEVGAVAAVSNADRRVAAGELVLGCHGLLLLCLWLMASHPSVGGTLTGCGGSRKKIPSPWMGRGRRRSGHSWVPRVLSAAAFSSSASAGLSALTYATYRLANDRSPRERATCTAPLVVPITTASSLSRSVPYSGAPIPYVYWMAACCFGPRESTIARTVAHFFSSGVSVASTVAALERGAQLSMDCIVRAATAASAVSRLSLCFASGTTVAYQAARAKSPSARSSWARTILMVCGLTPP